MNTADQVGELIITPYDGGKVERSALVRCAHCDYTWQFRPGSGVRRGRCMRCGGLVCGRPYCRVLQCTSAEQRLENLEAGRPLDWRPIIVAGG